ncbi:MAG: hypothetical protein C4560_12605 [Nitrospiraceae bacterium]|nr:MAG: hypothetical protein C4560_12605 [Nitrospiraceae bacterium]
MRQDIFDNVTKVKSPGPAADGKYSRLIEALRYYDIINEKSNEKVTVKFNDGGIIFIEVEDKKVFK